MPAGLRLLHLIPSLDGGGAERQLVLLAGALHARGHELQVVTGRRGRHAESLAEVAGIHVLAVGGSHDPRLLLRVLDICRTWRPDVLQSWLTQMDVVAGLASRTLRLPWVLSERSMESAYPPSWKHALRRRLGRAADAVVANSAAGLQYWRDAGAAGLLRVIPNAVAACSAAPARHRADGPPLVLFAGRLAPEKNLGTLVDAFGKLGAEHGARLMICGEGPERTALERRIAAAGLGPAVSLEGYREDLPQLLQSASVLVAPSWFEGNPNVVLEAMAAGCPLVVSRIPGHETLLDERSALFADPADATGLAAALDAVLADPVSAARRAVAARARVAALDIGRIVVEWEQVYGQVSARHGGAGPPPGETTRSTGS